MQLPQDSLRAVRSGEVAGDHLGAGPAVPPDLRGELLQLPV